MPTTVRHGSVDLTAAELQSAPDGILSRPDPLRHVLADDRHQWGVRAVRSREAPAAHERDFERREVIRMDRLEVERRIRRGALCVCPSAVNSGRSQPPVPENGGTFTGVAAAMPGAASSLSTSSSRKRMRRSRSPYSRSGIEKSTNTSRSAARPMSTLWRRSTDRVSRPAAATTITASATCTTTSARRPRRTVVGVAPRVPLRSASTRSSPAVKSAGASPGASRCQERDRQRECDDAGVDAYGIDTRQPVGNERNERLQ